MKKSLLRSTGGAVYVEFLLAFIPLFFMFLGMLQMGLLYGASLVVQHSANVAARAGMVVWDDDPQYYDGAARRSIGSGGSLSSFANQAGNLIGRVFGGGASTGPAPTGGARQQAIEFAAGMPLLPLSPSLASATRGRTGESVRGALGLNELGDTPEARVAWGLIYNRMAMRVTWPTAVAQSGNYRTDFPAPDSTGDAGQIIARVTYLYNCQIPLANRLMCDDLFFIQTGLQTAALVALAQQFAAGDLTVQQFQDAMAAMQARNERRTRWQPRMQELGGSVNLLAAVSSLAGLRFVPITAEASMPLQAANYRYHGGGDTTGWEQQEDN